MYLPKRYQIETQFNETRCGYISRVRRDGQIVHTTRLYLLRMDAVANARAWAGKDWQILRMEK